MSTTLNPGVGSVGDLPEDKLLQQERMRRKMRMRALENVRFVNLDEVRLTISEIGRTRVYNERAKKQFSQLQQPVFQTAADSTKTTLVKPHSQCNLSTHQIDSHPTISETLLQGISFNNDDNDNDRLLEEKQDENERLLQVGRLSVQIEALSPDRRKNIIITSARSSRSSLKVGPSRSSNQNISLRQESILQRVIQKQSEDTRAKEQRVRDMRLASLLKQQQEIFEGFQNKDSNSRQSATTAAKTTEMKDTSNPSSFSEAVLKSAHSSSLPNFQHINDLKIKSANIQINCPADTPIKYYSGARGNSSMRSLAASPIKMMRTQQSPSTSADKQNQNQQQSRLHQIQQEEEDFIVKEQLQILKQRELRMKQVKQKLGLVELSVAKTDQRKEVEELIESMQQARSSFGGGDGSLPKYKKLVNASRKSSATQLTFSSPEGYSQLKRRFAEIQKAEELHSQSQSQLQHRSLFKMTHRSSSPMLTREESGGVHGHGHDRGNIQGLHSHKIKEGTLAAIGTLDSSMISQNLREDLMKMKVPMKFLRAQSTISSNLGSINRTEGSRSQHITSRRKAQVEYFTSHTSTTTTTMTPRFQFLKGSVASARSETDQDTVIAKRQAAAAARTATSSEAKQRANTFYSNLIDYQNTRDSDSAQILSHLKKGFSGIAADLSSARDGLMDFNQAFAKNIAKQIVQSFEGQ